MPLTHRSPMISSALKKLTAAVASALVLTSAANAAGLGKLTVLSALGQPLRAEIELTSVSGDEAAGLSARLAPPEAFKAANIEFNPALLSLRFNVEQRGGRQFVRVTSSQPLNEPFVDLLLELSWNNGRLVREYTFLLDPAELRTTQPAQVAGGEAAPAALPAPAAPVAEGPRVRAQPRGAGEAAEPAGTARKYRVKPGDTLGRIATQVKPVDVSLDTMLVALYRANPDAFAGNNMNRLKSGRVLSVPATDAVRATDEGEAHGVVVAHAADFEAYRNKLAGRVAASEPARTPQASQSAGGKITAKVEERPTAANEAQDRLRLSKAAPSGAAGKDAATGATASAEDTIAKQKELAEAQARLKELERNVGDLENLATVKSRAAAEAEQKAREAAANRPADATLAPAANAPAPGKLPPIKPAAKPAPADEPGVFDFIMDNLALVGGGAAALLLGGLLVAQRRRPQSAKAAKTAKTVAEPSVVNVPEEPSHSMFADTVGQSVGTGNSVFNSSFAPAASQLDTNEVDPVAEADVYIAYGRDAQAEEILKEALRQHPERTQVRLKLLEIYAARKDQRAFEAQATELHAQTRGHGDEWAQAAALGLSIDPLNKLYAQQSDASATAVTAAAAEPMAFEQHFADALSNAQPAQQATAPQAQPAEDDHTLDFDLGGLSFEPASASTTAQPVAQSADTAQDRANDLDFDMDPFDAPKAVPAPADAGRPAADAPDFEFDLTPFPAPSFAPEAAPAAAFDTPVPSAPADEQARDFAFDMDFDMPATRGDDAAVDAAGPAASSSASADEFTHQPLPGAAGNDVDMASLARELDLPDLPPLSPSLPAAPEQAAPASELDDPLFDLDTMDFGLAENPGAAQAAPAPAPASDKLLTPTTAASLDVDHHFLDFAEPAAAAADTGSAPASASAPDFTPQNKVEPVDPHFDFGGFDLDLPAAAGHEEPLPGSGAESTAAAAPAELSAAHMEMETKLDLALAYQEIGDKEGARELLEEVIKGGSSEQAGRANALRAELA